MRLKTMVFLAVFAATPFLAPRPAPAAVNVSISFFYDELTPYGRWESVGRWGDCWIPSRVAVGWAPYTDGEWIYTEYGWTWVSYDPWGGDPYHYGTWVWEDPWGWVWVPGTIWGPAWVTWCYSDTYVGWAPLPPTVAISWSGYAGPAVVVPEARYVFVPVNRLTGVRVSSVRLPAQQNATIFPHVQKVTSYSVSRGVVVNRGPSVTRIERAAHVRIPRRSVSEAKSRPVPLSQAGVQRGRRVEIAAPAPVRAREIAARKGGPAHAGSEAPRAETAPTRESSGRKTTAPRHEAAPKHEAPPPHGAPRKEAPPKHEAPPPHHEAPPPVHREKAPPKHEAAPRHEAPPPPPEASAHHEPSPQAHREAAPSGHPAPPPHAERRVPPPKHEPPPPPPRGKKSEAGDDGRGGR